MARTDPISGFNLCPLVSLSRKNMYSSITPNKFCTLLQFLDNMQKMFITICSLLYNSKYMIIELVNKPKELDCFFTIQVPRQAKSELIFRVSLCFLLGPVYAFTSPLLLPFLCAYFALGYIVYRNQV